MYRTLQPVCYLPVKFQDDGFSFSSERPKLLVNTLGMINETGLPVSNNAYNEQRLPSNMFILTGEPSIVSDFETFKLTKATVKGDPSETADMAALTVDDRALSPGT